ncbi:TetR/AcrR family transcriptional regulator [Massilia sp. 2TAF26]|uniref:TetR/AcrR family transcriptional regulator n=1 Tax=Massilia sp. 2TAF26 TaxID=3233012 RepID=UPI003F985606
MNRPRGRPTRGQGVTLDAILNAALVLLAQDGGRGLSMRALAAQMSLTPMSLYHHVEDRAGLLRLLADKVYGAVPIDADSPADAIDAVRELLIRYHDAVGRHPQLTLAIFAEPAAMAGAAQRITERLEALLEPLSPEHILWRDILVDHAHGSGLALGAFHADSQQSAALREQYRRALDALLAQFAGAASARAA